MSAHLNEYGNRDDDVTKLNQFFPTIQVWESRYESECQDPADAYWGRN